MLAEKNKWDTAYTQWVFLHQTKQLDISVSMWFMKWQHATIKTDGFVSHLPVRWLAEKLWTVFTEIMRKHFGISISGNEHPGYTIKNNTYLAKVGPVSSLLFSMQIIPSWDVTNPDVKLLLQIRFSHKKAEVIDLCRACVLIFILFYFYC